MKGEQEPNRKIGEEKTFQEANSAHRDRGAALGQPKHGPRAERRERQPLTKHVLLLDVTPSALLQFTLTLLGGQPAGSLGPPS